MKHRDFSPLFDNCEAVWMEIFGWNVPLWLILIIVIVFAYYKYMTATYNTFKNIPGLRGPKPIIVAGTMADLYKKGVIAYDRDLLDKYGKVVTHFQGRLPCILVADLDMLKEILIKHHWSFNQRSPFDAAPPLDAMLGLLKGDHWKHVRSLVSPTFSTGKLRRMAMPMNQCCEIFVKNLRAKDGEAIDVRHHTGAFAMDLIASTTFGLDIDSQSDPDNPFVKNAQKGFLNDLMSPIFILFMLFPFTATWAAKLGISFFPKDTVQFFTRIIEEAMQKRTSEDVQRTDFLQLMINAHEDEEYKATREGTEQRHALTHKEVVAQGIGFFLAGFETVANALSFVLFSLATNTDVQEKVFREIDEILNGKTKPTYDDGNKMKYLDMVVSESLRLYTPASRVDRISQHDITVNGIFIPKGILVGSPIDYLHHDPDVYPDPYKFDPERFTEEAKAERNPLSYQPFGVGPRNCVAMRLALMEIKMAVVAIVRSFLIAPSPDTQVPPERHLLNGRPIDMKLKFLERNQRIQ